MGEIDEAGKYLIKITRVLLIKECMTYQPILDKLKGMNLDLINTAGQIFDTGEGGLEQKFRDFNTQQDDLANQLKDLIH